MDYEQFYELVIQEESRLAEQGAALAKDDRLCKALAACYELQDYLAGILAELVARGEMDDF